MTKFISVVAVLLVLVAVGAFAAGQSEGTAQPADEEEVYTALFWEHGPWTRVPLPEQDEDFIWQYIRDNYDLDIELQAAPSEGGDAKLNAMIAAGEIPDFIQSYWSIGSVVVQQYIDQGVLVPINEYVDEQPYLSRFLSEDEWAFMQIGDKKYALAQPRPLQNWNTAWVRQDWLDKLGLEMPQTMDELAEVAKAFTFEDPDGNGVDDTYGFTATENFGETNSLMAPFGAYPGHNNIRIENGRVVFDAFSDEAKDAITWWRGQLEAGVVDPNWATNRYENAREIISQGKVGLPVWQFQMLRKCGSGACLGEAIEAASPDANWVQVPALEGSFGSYAAWDDTLVDTRFWFTRSAVDEDGKMNAIMSFFNDIMNPETELYRTAIYGIEGVTYETDEAGMRIRRMSPDHLRWHTYWVVFRRGDEGYFWYYKQEPKDLWGKIMFSTSQPRIKNVTDLVTPHANWPDLEVYMQEMHMKFAVGQEPMSRWSDFLDTARTTYGLNEVIDDAESQLRSLGLLN